MATTHLKYLWNWLMYKKVTKDDDPTKKADRYDDKEVPSTHRWASSFVLPHSSSWVGRLAVMYNNRRSQEKLWPLVWITHYMTMSKCRLSSSIFTYQCFVVLCHPFLTNQLSSFPWKHQLMRESSPSRLSSPLSSATEQSHSRFSHLPTTTIHLPVHFIPGCIAIHCIQVLLLLCFLESCYKATQQDATRKSRFFHSRFFFSSI